jgi:hypothetical protein
MAKQDKTPDNVTRSSEFVIAPRTSPWLTLVVVG